MPASNAASDNALRHLQAQGRYLFNAAEFAKLTGREDNIDAARLALARLARAGRVASLVKQPSTWLVVPPEQQSFGAPPVTWWLDDFLRDTDPGYYLALLSAARHWGSAHYARQTTQVMLARPRRPVRVGKLVVEFAMRQNAAATPVEVARGQAASFRVSTREATLLDLVRHLKEVGGLEAVGRIAHDFVPRMTPQGLVQALDALGQTVAGQRLGVVLSYVSPKLAAPVARWLSGRRVQVQPLEPGVVQPDEPVEHRPGWGVTVTVRQAAVLREVA